MIIARLKTSEVDDDSLPELLAIYERYQINMIELGQFLTEKNQHWFAGRPHAYWAAKVFPAR